jgi:hypothetical protein
LKLLVVKDAFRKAVTKLPAGVSAEVTEGHNGPKEESKGYLVLRLQVPVGETLPPYVSFGCV